MRRVSSQTTVGRDAQLRLLDEALASAAGGEPQIVVLSGEAGVGKTRLVEELEARGRAREFTLLHGESVEFGGEAFPYAPFVAALRDLPPAWLQEALEDLDDERRDALATLLPRLPLAPRERRFSSRYGQGRLCELVLYLLGRIAMQAPVLVVLEDVHWADRSSRDLGAFLARNLRTERLVVALTYRTGELAPGHPLRRLVTELVRRPVVTLVEIAPLARADVALQVEAIAGRPVPTTTVTALYDRSGGNPFIVEELFAAGAGDVPTTLAEMVLARVERLSPAAQHALAVVAAAGGRVDHAVLATPGAALRETLDAGLVVSDADGVALRHGLIGEVVYGSLSPAERIALHRALGAALAAAGAPAAQLADQWHRAGAHDDALVASVAAGLDASDVYAFAEARTHFERALELWDVAGVRPQTIDHVELLMRTAQAARYAGDRERAVALGQRALDATTEPLRAARLYERVGEYASWDDRGALDSYTRALELLPPDATEDRARLLAAQGHALMGLRRWPESRDRCEAALAIADEPAAGITLGLVLAYLGDADAGEARLRGALAAAEGLGAAEQIARAYVHLGELLRLRGAHAEAFATMAAGERVALRLGLRSLFGTFMYVNAADDLLRLGRWDEAAQRLREAERMDLSVTAGAMRHATAARVHALRGELEAAHADLAQAEAAASAGLPEEFVAPMIAAKAELALAERDPARARREVEDALEALADDLDPLYAPALFALGVRAGAHELLGELDALLARSAPVPDAIAHRATAFAECDPLDPQRWEAAAALWDELSEPHPAARARVRQAEALLAGRGDRARVTALLAAANATATALGATPLQEEIEALARRARIRLALVEEPPAGGLTSREIEVLRLLAEGLTNRQIGERLFISEKTVGSHVAHIYEKLEVHSRGGAAGRAHALGVLT